MTDAMPPTALLHESLASAEFLLLAFQDGNLTGTEPHTAMIDMACSEPPTGLIPDGSELIGTHQRNGSVLVALRHPLGSLMMDSQRTMLTLYASATTPERARALLDLVARRVPKGQERDSVSMWFLTGTQLTRRRRPTTPIRWDDIRHNYPSATAAHLERLMTRSQPPERGRLLVFHGVPGTGKTHAIRALMAAWSPWCDAHVLTDPERSFVRGTDLDYVINGRARWGERTRLDRAGSGDADWRLLIAEDCDELLARSADSSRSSGLGRLLDITDGIIGQSSKTVVLLTTNEPVNNLHPALLRPGRCLARVEFERFGAEEARAWLPAEQAGDVSEPATLAELFALARPGPSLLPKQRDTSVGVYL